jgi:uncharacterized protein
MSNTAWPQADAAVSTVIQRYGLMPLEVEGGYWAPVYRTQIGNAILFLMTPDGFSALHQLSVTECWTWLAGAPATMLQLGPSSAEIVLDAAAPAVLVPPGTWQGTSTSGEWTLVMCWCLPAFTEECFGLGRREDLGVEYPQHLARITELTR